MKAISRRALTAAVTLGLTLGVSPGAHAADADTTMIEDADSLGTRPALFVPSGPQQSLPSPGTAFGLSFASTMIPVAAALLTDSPGAEAAAAAGVIVGPTVGYFYGGRSIRGMTGVLLRGGIAVVGVGIVLSGVSLYSENLPEGYDYAVVGAGILMASSALYDVVVVVRHVEKRNVERRRLGLEPAMRLASNGTFMAGVTLRR